MTISAKPDYVRTGKLADFAENSFVPHLGEDVIILDDTTGLPIEVRYGDGATLVASLPKGSVKGSNSGRSTQTGNASTTAFTIPHGLGAAPSVVNVTPGSAAAAILFYATSDATNITVTFSSAPAAAANNVVLNWRASL